MIFLIAYILALCPFWAKKQKAFIFGQSQIIPVVTENKFVYAVYMHVAKLQTLWWLSKDFLRISEDFLTDFHGLYKKLSEDFLSNFWECSEDFLWTFLRPYEDFLRTYWGLSENFLVTFWRLFKQFLNTFLQLSEDFTKKYL